MLKVIQNIRIFKMLHEAASDNVFTEFTTYAGQRYWSKVLAFMLVSLLVYRTYFGIFPTFQWNGIEPEVRDFSNMMAKMGAIFVLHSLRTLPCISSGPLALLGLMFFRSFSTPLTMIIGLDKQKF